MAPRDVLSGRGVSLPCGCDARTRLDEMPAALVDDVYIATRLPGHLLMGALLNVMNRHRDEVEAEGRGRTHVITLINSRAGNLI